MDRQNKRAGTAATVTGSPVVRLARLTGYHSDAASFSEAVKRGGSRTATCEKQAAEPGKRLSLRAAINAKCRSCIYDPGSGNGTWREQVEACTSGNCPLHPFRPLSRPKTRGDGAEASPIGRQPLSALHGSKNGLPGVPVGISEGGAA